VPAAYYRSSGLYLHDVEQKCGLAKIHRTHPRHYGSYTGHMVDGQGPAVTKCSCPVLITVARSACEFKSQILALKGYVCSHLKILAKFAANDSK
jgi:hypothetical protein